MASILIYCANLEDGTKLSDLAESRGLRVKLTDEVKNLLSWASIGSFDLVFIHHSLSISKQQEVAGLIWQKNPYASFVVYDLNEDSQVSRHELRLFGAELYKGKEALPALERHLSAIKPAHSPEARDFNVLVVEDLDSPRDIICFFLESMGFPKVVGKSSAKEAMQELENNPKLYSCVITDIRMPEISGRELIEMIRRHGKLQHLPIVVLTAHGTIDCLVECLGAGASGFLVKPPKKQDLTRELARALRILANHESPRLVTMDEAEQVRDILARKGLS